MSSLFEDVMHLFYPHLCRGCGSDQLHFNQILCFRCLHLLPFTGYIDIEENATERIFSGRIPISAAHSEFYFSKGKMIQQLLHHFKYTGDRKIGKQLGNYLGKSISQSSRFEKIDVIIPMPMYKKKEIKRGYNQADVIAEQVSKLINKPVLRNIVIKKKQTDTQTKKQRMERWQNIYGGFVVLDVSALAGKKILVIDDIITTGATIESCGREILKAPAAKLYVASLAIATK